MARATEFYGRRNRTSKEKDIIKLVSEGLTNQEVADKLNISKDTVRNYLCVIFDKCGVWNRAELTVWYLQHQTQ